MKPDQERTWENYWSQKGNKQALPGSRNARRTVIRKQKRRVAYTWAKAIEADRFRGWVDKENAAKYAPASKWVKKLKI